MERIVIVSLSNRNLEAVIDAEDAPLVLPYNWYGDTCGTKLYATRRYRHKRQLKKLYLHRVVMKAPAGVLVDHWNGNGLDCRKGNLRITGSTGNQANKGKQAGTYSTPYKGVALMKSTGRYVAYIVPDGKTTHLGVFATAEAAAHAYDIAATALWGEFAMLNFPLVDSRPVTPLFLEGFGSESS